MLRPRSTSVGLVLVAALVVLVGCSSKRSPYGILPPDLPANPETCAKYCKVWVDPVYRDVPYVVQTSCACSKEVPETVMETRYREVCEPGRTYPVCTPDKRCDQAVVQVSPGGYKWKRDGQCWRYCYEEPCYQWCDKVVTEKGIEYCMEVPPEYHVEAYLEPVTRYRTVKTPAEYEIRYRKELYTPGHYEWQPSKECTNCDCPGPCPPVPQRRSPCPNDRSVLPGCPQTN